MAVRLVRVRGLRQLFTKRRNGGQRETRGARSLRCRPNICAQVNRELRTRNARVRKKRAALELWRKTGEWLTPFRTAFCFRLPCVDRVDHETRLYAAQNVNEPASDPETCYLRRVILRFWYRDFLSLEFHERNCFFLSFSFFSFFFFL